jgi:methionyl-tRNA synthetase
LKIENGEIEIYSEKLDENLEAKFKIYENNFETAFKTYDLKTALDTTFEFLDEVNIFVTQKEPWKLLKNPTQLEDVKNILYTTLESIKQVSLNLYPFFPEKMSQVFQALNLNDYPQQLNN